MQANLATSHSPLLYSAMCSYASKFCDTPHNKAILKLELSPSPEEVVGTGIGSPDSTTDRPMFNATFAAPSPPP